jgi:hypothetical protein
VRACKLSLLAALILGCGGPDQPVNRSPSIAADSLEFRTAAENADRIAKEQKEAERKALGVRTLKHLEDSNR